jgi:hypothetical protein
MKAGVQKYITDDFRAGINSLSLRPSSPGRTAD